MIQIVHNNNRYVIADTDRFDVVGKRGNETLYCSRHAEGKLFMLKTGEILRLLFHEEAERWVVSLHDVALYEKYFGKLQYADEFKVGGSK